MPAMNATPYPVYNEDITAAKGCYVYDGSGRRWADMEAGVWCAALGHGHEAVNQALVLQLEQVAHSGYRASQPVVRRAAQSLLDILGMGAGQCVFLSSGSEAVELAVQAAMRMAPEDKPHVLCLQDFFLSSYGQSASRPDARWISLPMPGETGWQEAIDRLPFDRIGVFAFEPGNASGTVRLPGREAIREIVRRVRGAGGLVVADEVTTGMGRTGKWFGFEHYGFTPDIVACGKGLGNGYPVSAVALGEGLAERLLATGFRYAQSHQNDPLGCAVVQAVIGAMQAEDVLRRAAEMGAYFLAGLEGLAARHPLIAQVRGRGLMLAVELAEGAPLEAIHRQLYERGYVAGMNLPRNVLRAYPPLVVEKETVDGFLDAMAWALENHKNGQCFS